MPGILYRPLDRRSFLKSSVKALAGSLLAAPLVSLAGVSERTLHLALISDTHVAADPKSENRKFLPWDNLKLVASQVLEQNPEAVIHDGDVARATGELGDYEAAQKLLTQVAEHSPVFIGMGNHDNRENFHKVFESDVSLVQKVPDKHVLVIERPMLRVILLDSLLYTNKTPGFLGKAQRDWLDLYLARCDARQTIVFVHHTLGDADGELLDAEGLFRVVQPYLKVKAIFYGHSHQYSYGQHHGIHLINLPAVGYNFVDREPVGWVDAHFGVDGVDLTLQALGGNRDKDGKTTSLSWRAS